MHSFIVCLTYKFYLFLTTETKKKKTSNLELCKKPRRSLSPKFFYPELTTRASTNEWLPENSEKNEKIEYKIKIGILISQKSNKKNFSPFDKNHFLRQRYRTIRIEHDIKRSIEMWCIVRRIAPDENILSYEVR